MLSTFQLLKTPDKNYWHWPTAFEYSQNFELIITHLRRSLEIKHFYCTLNNLTDDSFDMHLHSNPERKRGKIYFIQNLREEKPYMNKSALEANETISH